MAELEQQARSGQPISLMDLAAAAHREEREKKKSVMEQLKSQPKAEHKKTAPKKSAETVSYTHLMRYKLVIAEKPSVAQSLAAVIGATARKDGYLEGNGWRVSWCVGHLAGLADADSYDPKYAKWRYDDLPILPEHWQMVVGKDKKKQFDILKKLMNAPDVTEVVNACDAGREGELIFRSVYELAGMGRVSHHCFPPLQVPVPLAVDDLRPASGLYRLCRVRFVECSRVPVSEISKT